MLIRCESHFSVSLIVGYMYFQNLGYISICFLTYGLKSLVPAKGIKALIMAQ